MPTHGSGCRFQDKGFSVYMTDNRKEPNKCLRCKKYKTARCKKCKDYSEFVDRGFIIITRTHRG